MFGLEEDVLPIPMISVPGMFSIIVSCRCFQRCEYALILFIAPILKEVDTTLHTVRFNGSLLRENVFRQDAGPEVDAAWASLGVHCESRRFYINLNVDSKLTPQQIEVLQFLSVKRPRQD